MPLLQSNDMHYNERKTTAGQSATVFFYTFNKIIELILLCQLYQSIY